MKVKLMSVGVMVLLAAFVVTATSQPPGKDGGDKKFGKKDKDGPPDGKGGPRWELGRVLPPFVVDELDLSETQLKQLAELQKEVKAKVLKILTEDQRKQLENMPSAPRAIKVLRGKMALRVRAARATRRDRPKTSARSQSSRPTSAWSQLGRRGNTASACSATK